MRCSMWGRNHALSEVLDETSRYHITFEAVGCQLTVTAQAVNAPEQATINYTDTGCSLTNGEIGVRTFYAGAAWRFVTVTPR